MIEYVLLYLSLVLVDYGIVMIQERAAGQSLTLSLRWFNGFLFTYTWGRLNEIVGSVRTGVASKAYNQDSKGIHSLVNYVCNVHFCFHLPFLVSLVRSLKLGLCTLVSIIIPLLLRS